ncbi:MAG: CRISPR-associated ring nuclease Csm6 [Rhodothermales bacterium]
MEHNAEPLRYYNLLLAAGKTPQVITETIWSLATQSPVWFPSSIHIITTSEGEAIIKARLLGDKTMRDGWGNPIRDANDRWTGFTRDILTGNTVVPEFWLPERDQGEPIDDIRNRDDDKRYANLCYHRVYELTRPGQPPLVGSIVGGRKTMSAHMMTAFCVYGRTEDRLIHVLVDALAEKDPDFFYPTPTKPYGIDKVDIPFPRLHLVLKDSLLDQVAQQTEEEQNFQAILKALNPYLATEKTPAHLVIHMGVRDDASASHRDPPAACLEFLDRDNKTIDKAATLSAADLATFLVFAEYTQGGRAEVYREQLMQQEVHRQRVWVYHYYRTKGPASLSEWDHKDRVSKSRSLLNKHIEQVPFAKEYLFIESTRATAAYFWARPLPTLKLITYKKLRARWPFTYLPEPAYSPS